MGPNAQLGLRGHEGCTLRLLVLGPMGLEVPNLLEDPSKGSPQPPIEPTGPLQMGVRVRMKLKFRVSTFFLKFGALGSMGLEGPNLLE